MTIVRKALWHLSPHLQSRLLDRILEQVERKGLGPPLIRVSGRHIQAGLELEFVFQGCSRENAAHYAAAALRDAAASMIEAPRYPGARDGAYQDSKRRNIDAMRRSTRWRRPD
jgi:hypothetical protein